LKEDIYKENEKKLNNIMEQLEPIKLYYFSEKELPKKEFAIKAVDTIMRGANYIFTNFKKGIPAKIEFRGPIAHKVLDSINDAKLDLGMNVIKTNNGRNQIFIRLGKKVDFTEDLTTYNDQSLKDKVFPGLMTAPPSAMMAGSHGFKIDRKFEPEVEIQVIKITPGGGGNQPKAPNNSPFTKYTL
jgi:hypothetical protein